MITGGAWCLFAFLVLNNISMKVLNTFKIFVKIFNPPYKPNTSSGWFQISVHSPEALLLLALAWCCLLPHGENSLRLIQQCGETQTLALLQLLPLRESKQQWVLFYLASAHKVLAVQWQPAPVCWWTTRRLVFWPVAKKKSFDKIQICIRCMVLPLGYSQGIFPDLMGVRRWGLNLKWVRLRTLGQLSLQFLIACQYSKNLRQ